jgi:hypothetical protein
MQAQNVSRRAGREYSSGGRHSSMCRMTPCQRRRDMQSFSPEMWLPVHRTQRGRKAPRASPRCGPVNLIRLEPFGRCTGASYHAGRTGTGCGPLSPEKNGELRFGSSPSRSRDGCRASGGNYRRTGEEPATPSCNNPPCRFLRFPAGICRIASNPRRRRRRCKRRNKRTIHRSNRKYRAPGVHQHREDAWLGRFPDVECTVL